VIPQTSGNLVLVPPSPAAHASPRLLQQFNIDFVPNRELAANGTINNAEESKACATGCKLQVLKGSVWSYAFQRDHVDSITDRWCLFRARLPRADTCGARLVTPMPLTMNQKCISNDE
jgi:hypothetical protein